LTRIALHAEHAQRGARKESFLSLYDSVVRVEKVGTTRRRATLPTGQTIDFGVHGPIAAHFRLEPEPVPLPVDYIVAATAG
jgi:hypothetical protein